jgi:hypothetical protein
METRVNISKITRKPIKLVYQHQLSTRKMK